jgi:hypothetical protein
MDTLMEVLWVSSLRTYYYLKMVDRLDASDGKKQEEIKKFIDELRELDEMERSAAATKDPGITIQPTSNSTNDDRLL